MAKLARMMILATAATGATASSLYDQSAVDIDGKEMSLSDLAGNISVVINVATFWGFTPSNYEMLKDLQQKYADQPVRFLVFPCNQFKQEPGSNADVKAFAEKSVNLGPGSNVIMFAKSNLNNVPCDAEGPDVCTAASVECCPANDGVYDYLLSATPPGNIVWNFDKIVVDGSGRPFEGETIFHGADLASAVNAAISSATVSAEVLVETQVTSKGQPLVHAMVLLSIAASFAIGMKVRRQQSSQQQSSEYIMLA